MADVQIQQPAASSGSGWMWGIVVLVLLAIIGWFIFGGGISRTTTAHIDINAPGAAAPASGSGGGTASGSVATPPKKP